MGRDRALLAALLPTAGGAVYALLEPVPDTARFALLLGSLAAVAILAVLEVAPSAKELSEGSWTTGLTALLPFGHFGPATGKQRTAAPGLTGSVPYALFGLATGVLVLYAALGDVLTDEERSAIAAPAAVALTLSMGPAEWLLYRFRSGSLAGLRSSSTPKAFWRTTVLTVVECLSAYLLALLALSLTTAALWPQAPGISGIRLSGLLLLGVVLWTGLLLQSFGAVLSAAAICCAAALAQTVALLTHTGGPHQVGLIVYGTAAVAQAALVCALLGRATAHR
jgi:hypothetical protein